MLKKEQKEALQLLIRLYADEVARASVGEVSNPAEQAEAINLFLDSITVPEGWKLGDELAPFHPDASHVEPGYRDGWNDCYRAMLAAAPKPGDSNE